ncbi:hypothetical protein CDIK_4495, partial [Cucumispora dikerogammari]
YNKKIKTLSNISEHIKENDKLLLEYIGELHEEIIEAFSSDTYELIFILVTYIINGELRQKEIKRLDPLTSKYEEHKETKTTSKQEKNSELLNLSVTLKNKILSFNEKVRYGDSIINNLIVGVKGNMQHNVLMSKLLDEDYSLNPYMIFLLVFCVFIFMFFFIKIV